MQKAAASSQQLIPLSSQDKQKNTIFLNLRDILQELGFSFSENPAFPENCFYATIGNSRPHVLFIAGLSITQSPAGAAHTALNCFIGACKQFISEKGCNGKISIFIQMQAGTGSLPKLNSIFNCIGILPQHIDFCIIGEPNRGKKTGQEINIGRLGGILFTITSFGDSDCAVSSVPPRSNAIQNLLNLLYKLKGNILDSGNETFSSSTISIISLKTVPTQHLHFPGKATASVLIRYNNSHTPQDIIRWMQNHINFTSGQFELDSELLSTPYISDISSGTDTLKQAIPDSINSTPRYNTNCTSIFSNFIKDYCPFAEFGLADGDKDDNENISCLRLIYYRFLCRYLGGRN